MSNTTSTTFTYDDDTYSDLHKEAYGFRPSSNAYRAWNAMTPAEKQAEWDYLCDAAESSVRDERNEEWKAMVRFEATVEKTIKAGAGDRETALRWLRDADEMAGADDDFFCFNNGLPYGYFGTGMFSRCFH